jgi:integrase/recombinase XerD
VSVFKRYKGKKLTSKSKDWDKGTWYVWKRIEGKIIHRAIPTAQTKQQAEIAERAIIEEAFNKKYGVRNSIGFSAFANDIYIRYCEQNNINIGAKRLYVRRLCDAFRATDLSDITPQDCRDVQVQLKRNTSNSSVNRIMSTLSRLFSLACEEGLLDRNPMQYVKSLKEPPPRNRLLTEKEKERLWKALAQDELMFRLVTLALNLPLRRGQLLAITPDALDLENGLLFAEASKGRDSRVIPLNSTAVTTLRLMREHGQLPFPLKDFRKRWFRALKAAKIEGYRFHDLRKEFASELIRKNVNPTIVQKLFAHSSLAITDIYMHAEMDQLKQAVNTLDDNVQELRGEQ